MLVSTRFLLSPVVSVGGVCGWKQKGNDVYRGDNININMYCIVLYCIQGGISFGGMIARLIVS